MATYEFAANGQTYQFDSPTDLSDAQIAQQQRLIIADDQAQQAAELAAHQQKTGILRALGSGYLGSVGGIGKGIGQAFDIPWLTKAGEEVSQEAGTMYQPTDARDTGVWNKLKSGFGTGMGLEGIAQGLGGMALPLAAAPVAAVAPAVGIPLEAMLWGTTTAAQAYSKNLDEQKKVNPDRPVDTQAAGAAALLEGGLAAAIGPMMRGGSQVLRGLMPDLMETLAPTAEGLAAKVFAGALTREEAIAQVASTARNVLSHAATATGVGAGLGVTGTALTRAQAGEELTSPEALSEYGHDIKGAATMALPFGMLGLGQRGKELGALRTADAVGKGQREQIAREQQADVMSSPEYQEATKRDNDAALATAKQQLDDMLQVNVKDIDKDSRKDWKATIQGLQKQIVELGGEPVNPKGAEGEVEPTKLMGTPEEILAAHKAKQEAEQRAQQEAIGNAENERQKQNDEFARLDAQKMIDAAAGKVGEERATEEEQRDKAGSIIDEASTKFGNERFAQVMKERTVGLKERPGVKAPSTRADTAIIKASTALPEEEQQKRSETLASMRENNLVDAALAAAQRQTDLRLAGKDFAAEATKTNAMRAPGTLVDVAAKGAKATAEAKATPPEIPELSLGEVSKLIDEHAAETHKILKAFREPGAPDPDIQDGILMQRVRDYSALQAQKAKLQAEFGAAGNVGGRAKEAGWLEANKVPDDAVHPQVWQDNALENLQHRIEVARAANYKVASGEGMRTLQQMATRQAFNEELGKNIRKATDAYIGHALRETEQRAIENGNPFRNLDAKGKPTDEAVQLENKLRGALTEHVGRELRPEMKEGEPGVEAAEARPEEGTFADKLAAVKEEYAVRKAAMDEAAKIGEPGYAKAPTEPQRGEAAESSGTAPTKDMRLSGAEAERQKAEQQRLKAETAEEKAANRSPLSRVYNKLRTAIETASAKPGSVEEKSAGQIDRAAQFDKGFKAAKDAKALEEASEKAKVVPPLEPSKVQNRTRSPEVLAAEAKAREEGLERQRKAEEAADKVVRAAALKRMEAPVQVEKAVATAREQRAKQAEAREKANAESVARKQAEQKALEEAAAKRKLVKNAPEEEVKVKNVDQFKTPEEAKSAAQAADRANKVAEEIERITKRGEKKAAYEAEAKAEGKLSSKVVDLTAAEYNEEKVEAKRGWKKVGVTEPTEVDALRVAKDEAYNKKIADIDPAVLEHVENVEYDDGRSLKKGESLPVGTAEEALSAVNDKLKSYIDFIKCLGG